MADFSAPSLSSLYTDFLAALKARDVDAITLCISDPTNIPTGAMKWHRANDLFQEWSGAAWVDQPISIAGGGTGGVTAASARSSLGLGTMAVQNSNAIAITGGSIGAAVTIDAASIVAGLVAQSRLGAGSAGGGTLFLADDQTYKATVVTGIMAMWGTAVAPPSWVILDGSAISRTGANAALFALWGTTYGVGDGSTTFNVPDLRQRFPLGKAASGTGNVLGATGGAIDHTHTSAAHTHPLSGVPAHTHTGTISVSITDPGHTHDYRADNGIGGGLVYIVDGGFVTENNSGSGAIHSNTTGITASGTVTVNSSGSTTATDSTTPGATGTNNPPYFVVNFIVKL